MSFSCFPDFISCLLACFLPFFFHPPCFLLSLPAILTHTHTHNKKEEEEANTEIETSVVRQIIACILDFFIYVCTLFTPKPACFMHCVGGGMHFFLNIMPHLSLSRVKMQSLYLAHPFRLVLLFALIQLLRRVSPVIFRHFSTRSTFFFFSFFFSCSFPFARESGRDRRQVAEQV